MKFTIFGGINNCTLLCSSAKNADLKLVLKIFKYFPKNKKNTIVISNLELIDKLDIEISRKTRIIAVCNNDGKKRSCNILFFKSYTDLIGKINTKKKYPDSKFFNNENIAIIDDSDRSTNLIYRLEEKSRPTKFEIDLNALAYNVNLFRKMLMPKTKILCLVKAESYGTGNYEIACLLQSIGVDYFAVAGTDEGVLLRKSGIKLPIMVLTPEIDNLQTLIRNNLEPEVYNFRSFESFANECEKLGKTNYPIHIKINSGMNRQGFIESELDELIEKIKEKNSVKVISVFTHLATADKYALKQLKLFERLSLKIQKALPYKTIRHALNSIGIKTFPEYQFDMVRLGIGMYGIGNFEGLRTKNVGSLTSVITQIREVPPHERIGYGRKGIVGSKPKTIGIVPIGYADGLSRCLGMGKLSLNVNGKLAPIIGQICMDICMIDITKVDAKETDKVIVFGEKPTALELANKQGTIPYEIFTNIHTRVKKVYYWDL